MSTTSPTRTPREIPKVMNQLMSLILRSPLHGMMSSQLMLLSFYGRKTGKLYTTPVGYLREGQVLTVFTDHSWWKNLQANKAVQVVVQGKKLQGTADVILDKEQEEAAFRVYLQRLPGASRAFGVEKNSAGELDQESLHQTVQHLAMVQIRLK